MKTRSDNYLILVRHGSTEWNESGRLNGITDVSLSSEGFSQGHRLGQELAGCRFDSVLASSRLRSQQTAHAILEASGHGAITVEVDDRLDEVDFGDLENRPIHTLERPNLELCTELLDRVRGTLPRIEDLWASLRDRKGVTLAVSHGYLIRAMLCSCVLQSPIERLRRFQLSSCGVAVISWLNEAARLACFNGSGQDVCRIVARNNP